ncbi:uncharacterized protein LOC119386210 [Rhipicephalus sanguineus]|uniref:uncharacterized protein LOC119386210 n=1 Tax=Rhipicephalus sanguineus TaxID=34632 RepID=UPI0020C4427D|nr:uncharacterized protein LOC119386210 [Rhipicephalus sanguineus]
MLRRMTELGMPQEWTDLLRRLYADSSVVARLADTSSEPVKVSRGLRQGCPLSPLLYMLYASGLESALIQSNIGFKMKFLSEGQPEVWTLPGLVFADDIVLLAEDRHQLQQLVTISAHHLAGLGLRFNPQKSAVVQFAGEVDTNLPLELPNGDKLPFSTEYRYLGVTIGMGEGHFLGHEDRLRQTSQRASCILRRRSLWGCNRYVLVRELWKSVHVPCLTFANAIICLTSRTPNSAGSDMEAGSEDEGPCNVASPSPVASPDSNNNSESVHSPAGSDNEDGSGQESGQEDEDTNNNEASRDSGIFKSHRGLAK